MKFAGVYGRMGWPVIPLHSAIAGVCSCSKGAACPSSGKHPRIGAWEQEATADAETIAEWVERWPDGNIGIVTGREFWVLDVDPKNDGPATLAALEAKHGALPHTPQAETGSGGAHYLFALPGFPVKNSAGKLGAGLDTRGEGGQIVVAPSVSARGVYSWVRPPWSTKLAPAPAWLLELLKAKSPTPSRHASPSQGAAVSFPPAPQAVLELAREALDFHGPAVEGEGGDQHTFVAAALLAHDFALGEDQAWPLLVEWNATCRPPWSESDLAAKLRGGAKYATRPYGCRRTLDIVEIIQAMIAEWRADPNPHGAMPAFIARVRPLVGVCDDTTKHALIVRELRTATGLGQKDLRLPDPAVKQEAPPPGSITLTPALHEVADEAVKVIRDRVFARNGVLCEVVKAERTFIADLEAARVRDLMSTVKWVRPDGEGGNIIQAPPLDLALIVQARRQHAGVRVLEAVTTAPIFLADGSILQVRGYNAQARVYLEPSVVVDVPDEPTRDDARAAAVKFYSLLSDFHFASKADFSAWLAGLLSPLVKSATGNAPAPLVAVSASTPGAGKSKLVNLASLIIMGAPAEVRPYNPRDPSEWGKRVTSFVRAGAPISVFDNVNGAFGDETIDRLLTSSTWSDRVLGASDAPPIAVTSCWWATGNNLEPHGDTVRRVLPVRLDVREERPQERTGFKLENIEAHALEHRSELLSAALTILRAYHVAGRPAQRLPSWGSFEAWSEIVRAALVWVGLTDPFETQRRAQLEWNDVDTTAHEFWIGVIEASDGTPESIAATANAKDASGILGARESITPFALRRFVGRFVDRVRRGLRIRREVDPSATRYYVERIAAVAA